MTKQVTVDQVLEIYPDPAVLIVDARPSAAFNGWRLRDEARGGHIPGAVLFSSSWALDSPDTVLAETLAAKGITPARSIVVYGYEGDTPLAARLESLGYDNVSVLTGGLEAWAARDDLDLASLPGYSQLVYPE